MNNLQGSSTTVAGIVSIIMSGLALFTQIWGAAHGAPLDPTQLTGGVSGVVAGVGLIKAADAKQR